MRERCPHCGHDIEAVKTLVAVQDKTTETTVVNLLKDSGIEVLTAREGREIFGLLESSHPEVTILDGGFPGIFGFHFAEIIRKSPRLQGTRVILVSTDADGDSPEAVPSSRVGADACLESHQLPKKLLDKIQELLPERFSPDATSIPPPELPEIPEMTQDGEKETSPNEEAKRFARIIISDIALYNAEKVDEGIQNGTFFDLLKDDIREGRELYHHRFSDVTQADYYEEAITDFLRNLQ
jgi:CheY-like chemotaxis protein